MDFLNQYDPAQLSSSQEQHLAYNIVRLHSQLAVVDQKAVPPLRCGLVVKCRSCLCACVFHLMNMREPCVCAACWCKVVVGWGRHF